MATHDQSKPTTWHALDFAGDVWVARQGQHTLGFIVLTRGAWHYTTEGDLCPVGPFGTLNMAKFELERSFGVMPREEL